jgi:hypothetical protein
MHKRSCLTGAAVILAMFLFAIFGSACKNRVIQAGTKSAKVPPEVAALRASCSGGNCHGAVSKSLLTRWQRNSKVVIECLKKKGFAEEPLASSKDPEGVASCFEDYPQGAGLFRTFFLADDFEKMMIAAKRSKDDIEYFKSLGMPPIDSATSQQKEYIQDEKALWRKILWFSGPQGESAIDQLPDESFGQKSCVNDRISRSLVSHLTASSDRPFANWWSRKNMENQLQMFACPDIGEGSYNPSVDCFRGVGEPVAIGNSTLIADGEIPFSILKLRDMPRETYYWMRVSPDGRFVGNGSSEDLDPKGGGFEGFFDDLKIPNKRILVRAKYDPAFTPDNEWFLFQGANGEHQEAAFCRMANLLTQAKIIPAPPVCLGPTENDGSHIGLYQSIGADPEGGPYLVAQGGWENDNGGNSASGGRLVFNTDPLVKQGKNNLNLFVFDGSKSGLAEQVALSNEGDWVVSPSTRLVVGRYGQGSSQQHGYRIHMLRVQANSGKKSGYSVARQVVGEICNADPATQRPVFRGGKVQISLDDRFLATHRYSATTEGVPLDGASADILIYDALTGNHVQVTNMPKGMYALYPSWRSDGWLYFLVRDRRGPGAAPDYVAVTNAAFWLAQQQVSRSHIVDDSALDNGGDY